MHTDKHKMRPKRQMDCGGKKQVCCGKIISFTKIWKMAVIPNGGIPVTSECARGHVYVCVSLAGNLHTQAFIQGTVHSLLYNAVPCIITHLGSLIPTHKIPEVPMLGSTQYISTHFLPTWNEIDCWIKTRREVTDINCALRMRYSAKCIHTYSFITHKPVWGKYIFYLHFTRADPEAQRKGKELNHGHTDIWSQQSGTKLHLSGLIFSAIRVW